MDRTRDRGADVLTQLNERAPTRFYWQLTILATIGGFLFGYDTANIGSALDFVPYHIHGFTEGYLVAGASIGAAVGALAAGPLTDRFGRKSLLIVDAGIYAVGAILSAVTWNLDVLLSARTLIGLAVGADSAIATAYIAEWAPKNRRGSLAILQQWMITVGILVAYIIALIILKAAPGSAYTADWRIIFGLGALPALVGLVMRVSMPESPRWLLRQGKLDKAGQAFGVLGIEASDADLRQAASRLTQEEHAQQQTHRRVWTPGVKRALIVVSVFFIFQQITGINVPFYYGPQLLAPYFGGTGSTLSSAISGVQVTAIMGAVNVIATYFGFRWIDRHGRRKLAMGGYAGMAVFILVAAAGISFLTGTPKLVLVVIGLDFFIASFAIGVGGTGWLIQGEVFPTQVRGRAAAIGATVDWLANFVLIEVFPVWHSAIGLSLVMVCFAVLSLLAIGFVALYLPETKGLPVEEIIELFERTPAAGIGGGDSGRNGGLSAGLRRMPRMRRGQQRVHQQP